MIIDIPKRKPRKSRRVPYLMSVIHRRHESGDLMIEATNISLDGVQLHFPDGVHQANHVLPIAVILPTGMELNVFVEVLWSMPSKKISGCKLFNPSPGNAQVWGYLYKMALDEHRKTERPLTTKMQKANVAKWKPFTTSTAPIPRIVPAKKLIPFRTAEVVIV